MLIRCTVSSTRSSPVDTESPLKDYLRDPAGTVHSLLNHATSWVAVWGPVAGPVLAITITLLAWLRWWWRRHCRQVLALNARLITVLPPPGADPAGAEALWTNLLGLLRPAWRRLLTGQPHVSWEYIFDREEIRIRLWVPGVVPPGLVERAVEAAWPGARTHTTSVTPIPEGVEAAGGEMRLARSEALPIRSDFPADPIRALLGAPVGLGPQEQVVVQVLARPVTGRRAKRARRTPDGIDAVPLKRVIRGVLDLLTPGHHHPSTRRVSTTVVDRQTRLSVAAEDKAIVLKQRSAPYVALSL